MNPQTPMTIDGISCLPHEGTCKFCQRPITLWVSVEYPILTDPNKVRQMAACKRCAEMMTNRRNLRASITRLCEMLLAAPGDQDMRQRVRGPFIGLTKRYVRMVSDFLDVPELPYDESIVDELMARPEYPIRPLARVWNAGKHMASNKQLFHENESHNPNPQSEESHSAS